MSKIQIKISFFIVVLLLVYLTTVRCFPIYQGDGELFRDRTLSIYPTYQIYFPPFPLETGRISLNYRFRGVSASRLTLRLYLLSKSGKRVRFNLTQKNADFLDKLSISVRMLENEKEVINIEKTGLIFGGSGNLHYLSTHGGHLIIPFSSTAIYELQIVVEAKENPPVPLKIQFALSHGHGCPTKPCEEVLWDDLLKN